MTDVAGEIRVVVDVVVDVGEGSCDDDRWEGKSATGDSTMGVRMSIWGGGGGRALTSGMNSCSSGFVNGIDNFGGNAKLGIGGGEGKR